MMKIKGNKSQMTLFLILAVLLLIAVMIVIIFGYKSRDVQGQSEKLVDFDSEVSSLRSNIEDCLKSVSEDAIEDAYSHSGYYHIPIYNSTAFSDGSFTEYIPFLFSEGNVIMPGMKFFEDELDSYIEDYMEVCTQSQFENYPYLDISEEDVISETKISENRVSFRITYPVTISHADNTKRIDQFSYQMENIRMLSALESTREYLTGQESNPYMICLTCLKDAGVKYGFTYQVEGNYEDDVIVHVYDNISGYYDKPFTFAIKFMEDSCDSISGDDIHKMKRCMDMKLEAMNYTFYVEDIPDMQAYVGEPFSYKIDAKALGANFESYSRMIDVSDEGIISFLPTEEDIGEHDVFIHVSDDFNNRDMQSFTLNVTRR